MKTVSIVILTIFLGVGVSFGQSKKDSLFTPKKKHFLKFLRADTSTVAYASPIFQTNYNNLQMFPGKRIALGFISTKPFTFWYGYCVFDQNGVSIGGF